MCPLVLYYARSSTGWCYAGYHWLVLAGCVEVRAYWTVAALSVGYRKFSLDFYGVIALYSFNLIHHPMARVAAFRYNMC